MYFLKILNTISESLTRNEISQNGKHHLRKILAWFIIDYFVHNIDLLSKQEKHFHYKVQTTNLYWQMKQIRFGTLNGLIHYLLLYQLICQVKQFSRFPSIEIMLG